MYTSTGTWFGLLTAIVAGLIRATLLSMAAMYVRAIIPPFA
jgi:hypothetical protein